MAGPRRAVGVAVGCNCVHVLPSYSQVSPSRVPLAALPPNSTIRPRTESYVIPAQTRAGGSAAGLRWVQFVPSHSHVEKLRPPGPDPPNSTETPRALSYAIAAPATGGGEVAGDIWLQLKPFQLQVSDRFPGPESLLPPNRTDTPRSES